MSDLRCNGLPVLAATLRLPRVGAWTADLQLDGADAPSVGAAVTLASADGALSMRGTVARGGPDGLERGALCVVGGAGRLAAEVPPQYYRGAPARLPVGDLLREAGETISPTSQASVLDRLLSRWVRERAPASTALGLVLDAVGGSWRVLPDGTVWIGEESWPDAGQFDHELIDEEPAADRVVISAATLPTALLPGTTFRDRRVSYVQHELDASHVRTTAWFEREGDTGDRIAAAFEALVRRTMRGVFFHVRYPARVVSQAADLTLSLRPDDPALPGLVGVPIRTFAPSASIKVAADARVLIAFEGGDPRHPVAELWGAGALQEIKIPASTRIELGNSPSQGVARDGDDVEYSAAFQTWIGAVTAATGVPALPTPIIGAIAEGSAKVFAE